jgi:hypothetical protein
MLSQKTARTGSQPKNQSLRKALTISSQIFLASADDPLGAFGRGSSPMIGVARSAAEYRPPRFAMSRLPINAGSPQVNSGRNAIKAGHRRLRAGR